MSNIVSFDEFKKKNGTNLPTSKGSSQVVSFQDFKVRNTAQGNLKNSPEAKFYNYLTQPKQVETAQDKRNTWFNAGAKGNILQKTAGTVGDIGLNVVKGIAGAGEKLGDLASYGVAGVADILGAKDYAKNVREAAQVNLVGNTLQPLTNFTNQYSLTGDKLDSIVQSVGESYAMSKVGGVLGKTKAAQKVGLGDKLNKEIQLGKLNINIPLMSVLTGASSGITEAYQKGGDNQQAFIKGLTSGLAEGISEGLFGVFGQGGSSFENEVMYKATKKIENQLARRLTKLGITAAGEGAEEGISYAFNYVADNLQDIVNEAFGKEINKMGDKWNWNEFGENILSGAIAGGLSGGAELLGGGRGAAILESTQHQVENTLNRALTDAEIVTLEQETRKQLEKGKINIDQIVNRLQNPTVEDLVQQQGIKSDTTPQLDSGLQQQLQLPTQNFTVDTSGYSGTQLQTYQNAINSGLLNNNKNTHDFVDFVSKISKDKGIVFNFTNNQALQDRNINAQINGFIDNNGITLNVDSNMALEKVIGHEITHTLENMVNEYESLKNSFKQLLGEEEFNTRLEQIKDLYKGIEGANYENELISDLAGEYLFTNEDFINRLSTQKPSLFRRIYEEIKYLWKMATGTSQEKQLARTMRIYEQAYRNAGKVSNYNVDSFAQNTQNAQETQTTPQETKPEIKKYPNLTEEEAKEYEFLDSLPFDLTGEDLQTYERLQRKMEGKPILPTRKDIQFKDIARDYGKYKDLEGYNAELTKDAESLVPDRQGRRTKEQWLDVASFIGERFKGNDEQLKKYAIQSWLAERPNNKDRLNRQGKGYVKFTIEEWLNKIYESANRTKPITQYSLSKELDDYVTNNNYSFKDNGNLEVKNLTDKQIKDLVKIYHTTGYEDVSADYLRNMLKSDRAILQREVADRFIEKELGHKPVIDKTKVFEDAEGRKLTKEQVEFYKNSDVRDIRGRLIPVYHKTNANFTVFDKGAGKQHGNKYGQGFYFSITPENYGNNTMEVYLNAKDGEYKYIPKMGYYIVQNPNQIKNVDNLNPTESDDIRYQLSQRQENLPIGQFRGKDVRRDINVPTTQENALNVPLNRQKRVLNPLEISNLNPEDANTTPILPTTRTLQGDKQSRFLNNINQTEMLTQESKDLINNADIGQYRSVTNEESLRDASQKLSKGGKAETERWFRNDPKNVNATDIAEGFILLNQYQELAKNATNDADKYQANQSMVEVAKKLRQIGTEAGQTLQAYSILSRMTPEGMVYYAQSELTDAYNEMVKNKSRQWIEQHREDFELKPEETQFILDTMNEVANMEDGYDKKVKLAEIQKLMTDKLPPEKGKALKSWMRVAMLFNPKTQVRNVAGNALIAPVNTFADIFSSYADKLVSRKTGKRTTGTTNIKAMLEGFKKGAYEATTDYRKGINTRDIEGNRFEIGEGKSFNDKSIIGKALNNTEGLLNYVMDAGDRIFSEAAFENSLQNQLKLNNTNEITQDMIDIARQEALSRTWNDNNNYTKFVLNVRSMLNKINFGAYGLGDVLIPFAKTPANLTKAIVDYSPVGFVNTLLKGNKLSRSLENGQYTPQLQHDFVQTLGKATAGTMLYVLGAALAKAGITSGESDDDKDTQNFLKNTLGISNYSIKIGNKSFTYDWAQPLAAPLSITANIEGRKDKEQALGEAILSNLDTASSVLLEQSFMQGINEVLNNNGKIVDGMLNQVLGLPARAIPTLSKQIVDLTDSTQRTSFEYGKPVESAINAAKAKIPGLSKTLAPVVDTMGREVQRYGGKNNLFNVFLNPANVNTENISESAAEIYRVYKETGDKTIMPRVAPYYINQKNEKITLNSKQKAEFQRISGEIIDDNVKDLIDNQVYENLNDTEKALMIKNIVDYSYNKARKDVLNIDMSSTYNKINEFVNDGGTPAEYYTNKEEIDYAYANPSKYQTIRQIAPYYTYKNYNTSIETLKNNYSTTDERKNAVINYVNGLELGIPQKAMLIRMNYSSFKQYDNLIIDYINSQDLTVEQKSDILKVIGFTIKNGVVYN